jgi:hypothetical protein
MRRSQLSTPDSYGKSVAVIALSTTSPPEAKLQRDLPHADQGSQRPEYAEGSFAASLGRQ